MFKYTFCDFCNRVSESCCRAPAEPPCRTPASPYAWPSACPSPGPPRGWLSPGCGSPWPTCCWSATGQSSACQRGGRRWPRGRCSYLQCVHREGSERFVLEFWLLMLQCMQPQIIGKGASMGLKDWAFMIVMLPSVRKCAVQSMVLMLFIGPVI